METTFNLPAALLDKITQRALQERRDVEDVVAVLLAAGLSSTDKTCLADGPIAVKNLPLMMVHSVQPAEARQFTTQEWCDWIKAIDLQLEVERYETALGHQHLDRADPQDAPPS